MESLRRQTFSSVLIILSLNKVCVFCQNGVQGSVATPYPFFMEPIKEYEAMNPGSTSPKLMNTLMNVAAAKGVPPELIPLMQSMPAENQQQQMYQNVISQPIGPEYTQQGGMPQTQTFTAIPQLSIALPNSNCPPPPPTPPVPACYLPSGMPTPPLPTFIPPDLTLPFLQPILPPFMPQNYPFIPPAAVNPTSVPQPLNQFEACLPISPQPQVVIPCPNFQVTNLPPVSTTAIVGGPCTNSLTTSPQSGVVSDGQLPINLQINVPSPSVPAPKITIITPAPISPPTELASIAPNFMGNYFPPYGMYPPFPMPIIMERPRSKLRSWLPILLIALFSRDGGFREGGNGCCNCCCPCNCGGSNIPIPYPMPIPTNNPIIMNSPYSRSPRKRGSRRDVYEDFDSDDN